MIMNRPQAPQENIEIFALLYCIETALRELIIETLSATEGPRWYKRCLPGDILEKYRKGKEVEKQTPWTQCIPHHPIYYVDFPDLKKIIEREDNWKKAFERIFSRKDILSGTLSELEPIRNKIAHNRKTTSKDIEVVSGVYSVLSAAIGSAYFVNLANRCTLATGISEQLTRLQMEAKSLLCTCLEFRPVDGLQVWGSVHDEWWFDETYLGEELDKIVEFFRLIKEYSHLPRLRGSGHRIEAWVRSSGIETKYANAQVQFSTIFASGGINYGTE